MTESIRRCLHLERRRLQLSAKASMRRRTICFRSRRIRPLISPLSDYRDYGAGRAVPMPENREVMHENAAA
ncbi:hypothetical protein CO656_21960 [Sinorhizobium sp. FG01]|nr:hypothetical protein CO656_21960 [Sinorhizobium sp. FG01]